MFWVIIQAWTTCWFCVFRKSFLCQGKKAMRSRSLAIWMELTGLQSWLITAHFSVFLLFLSAVLSPPSPPVLTLCSAPSLSHFVSVTICLILCHGRYFPLQTTKRRSEAERCVLVPKLPWPLLVFHIICLFL